MIFGRRRYRECILLLCFQWLTMAGRGRAVLNLFKTRALFFAVFLAALAGYRSLARFYSNASGSMRMPLCPADFFSQYFLIQASQLFPAAVSRPVNASAAISA
jgi:hypothetical protein